MSRREDHYAESQWNSGWIEKETPRREPRARFAGALLLLWVVAFAAVCLVWEVLT